MWCLWLCCWSRPVSECTTASLEEGRKLLKLVIMNARFHEALIPLLRVCFIKLIRYDWKSNWSTGKFLVLLSGYPKFNSRIIPVGPVVEKLAKEQILPEYFCFCFCHICVTCIRHRSKWNKMALLIQFVETAILKDFYWVTFRLLGYCLVFLLREHVMFG